ncbi:hypothetical protein WJ45_20115 [Burkholderia ubonensis]|nr:hypothetical protein WJ45_20115 [Burkholderia ubonensis]KVQ44351.1 hypothetical protein WK04_15620 [Burkholderia ubonensis]
METASSDIRRHGRGTMMMESDRMGHLLGAIGQRELDGYAAWRTLKKATHFGCMAYARRMFNPKWSLLLTAT